MKTFRIEVLVGLFVLLGGAGLFVLAFKVSGLTLGRTNQSYTVKADFDNVGDLKVRAPITVAGVRVGEVTHIQLDPKTYQAIVALTIQSSNLQLPTDSTASILTAGLLGAKYIGLTPGFDENVLKQGDRVMVTHSAVILENLIGQFLFSINKTAKK